jgi:16S rRNA C967 or C1407 C5-methylase (RsmB/RsmF family)/NOL1/NOP2/fmu family ribosome biogenesis protein
MKLPEIFLKRLATNLPKESFSSFLDSYLKPSVQGIRIHQDPNQILHSMFTQPIPWHPLGRYVSEGLISGNHPYHHAGAFYFQEPSAMAVVPMMNIQPNDFVLDLAAAPGSKSTDIARQLSLDGFLVANDVDTKRAQALMHNVERMGLTQVVVTQHDPQHLCNLFPHFFNKILIDAPCSGEGMFRKDENAIEAWSVEHVQMCAVRQSILLNAATMMLKSGGTIVYSTCTFSPEENEQMIQDFIQKNPMFQVITHPLQSMFDATTTQGVGVKLWPHQIQGEGHYVVILKHQGVTEPRMKFQHRMRNPMPSEWREFATQTLTSQRIQPNFMLENRFFMIPTRYAYHPALHTLRAGVFLGDIDKKYFYPSHHLAHVLTSQDVQRSVDFRVDDTKLLAYMRGEEIQVSMLDGWTLVTVDGLSLGWGKVSQGRMKNHYPKGLRLNQSRV